MSRLNETPKPVALSIQGSVDVHCVLGEPFLPQGSGKQGTLEEDRSSLRILVDDVFDIVRIPSAEVKKVVAFGSVEEAGQLRDQLMKST